MNTQPCRCSTHEVQELICEIMDPGTPVARAHEIRRQIAECPQCLQRLRTEHDVRAVMRTCCQSESAPGYLRERITTQIRITYRG